MQQLPAASSLRTHRCLCDICRRSECNCTVPKKYAACAMQLQRPANPASAKSAAVIRAASSHAAASSLAQREEERSHAPESLRAESESFSTNLPVAARDKDYLCGADLRRADLFLPAGGRAELSLAHPSPPPLTHTDGQGQPAHGTGGTWHGGQRAKSALRHGPRPSLFMSVTLHQSDGRDSTQPSPPDQSVTAVSQNRHRTPCQRDLICDSMTGGAPAFRFRELIFLFLILFNRYSRPLSVHTRLAVAR